MQRQLISSGAIFESKIGFSRAVRVGPHIAVSGTAPIAPGGGVACPGDLYGQTLRCQGRERSERTPETSRRIPGSRVCMRAPE